MAEPEQDNSEFTAETAVGKFRIRGYDTITILLAIGVILMSYILWSHTEDTRKATMDIQATNKEVAKTLAESNREITKAINESVRTQRLTACILATKEDQRETQYAQPNSFCNRISQ